MSDFTIGVVGNPNCGKTTLFNALTGSKQKVGNWPGVTVDRKEGFYQYDDKNIQVVDLPGIYSLDVILENISLDEQIAQTYILSNEADLIINIVDASNLERNLYLTTQVLDMQVPMIIALNMMDIAAERNIAIDVESFALQLGVPVVPVTASKNQGIEALKKVINHAAKIKQLPRLTVDYPSIIESAIADLSPKIVESHQAHQRWIALKLLEDFQFAQGKAVESTVTKYRQLIEDELQEDMDIIIADNRYTFIAELVNAVTQKTDVVNRSLSEKIDKIVLNRVLGIPIFLVTMYLMFMFTINIGGAFVDFFDVFFGTLLVDGLAELFNKINMPAWLTTLLANGGGGGIQTIATFIPIIGFLYLFLSFLEDSGYMARAAFVMDRFMRAIGLPGKSFVPMIVGFGCNVPAIMATRTLENPRDRLLTILMNPFMSCGARLPVYALFAAAFFPVGGQNLVFGLYLLGIAVAVMTGLIMKSTILRSEASHFIMELPPYHLPTLKTILLRTWERVENFIFKAGQVIVPMVVVLSFLNSWGTDGSFGNENSDQSVLSEIGRSLTPAFEPMGIRENNWPATVGIFTGILAKEAVVGTLDSVYTQLAEKDKEMEEERFDFWQGISSAFASIPDNLKEVANNLLDPLGLNIGEVSDMSAAAEEQAVSVGTFGAMATRFDGKVGAFAYLLFILLYTPCLAATAAIYRESNARWTTFVVAWTTGLAYCFSTLFYQTATLAQHPEKSIIWIISLILLFGFTVFALKMYGQKALILDKSL